MTIAAAAAVDATAARAARGPIAGPAYGGGLRAALARRVPLLREAAAIALVVLLAVFGVYHFAVRTIHNPRPVGGVNVDVTRELGTTQSEASFAVDREGRLFGATEELRVYTSVDGGRRWALERSPRVRRGCAHGEPQAAVDARGREYLAFLASFPCGDDLTPYVVVTSRDGPGGSWSTPVRVAPRLWTYGFDDAPSLAVDSRRGRLYLAWTRSVSRSRATVVASSSRDGGRTWSEPFALEPAGDHPHLAAVAVSPSGDVYVTGIDARRGIWIARSTDGGRTFTRSHGAAPLAANPAADCALGGLTPLPTEERTCIGPHPVVLATRSRVYVVYGDAAANGSSDLLVVALDAALRPRFVTRVNPPDRGRAEQFFPAATVDPATGVLWACWYDTTFDENAHRAWFTCSASHDGRIWSAPLRASAEPTSPNILYGTLGGAGLYAAVAARQGVAHVFWADGRVIANSADIFTAAIPEKTAFSPEN